jgi:ribosomal protein S27AE
MKQCPECKHEMIRITDYYYCGHCGHQLETNKIVVLNINKRGMKNQ